MKLILVNQRYGHTRTIVIRGWMKGLLSLCLLGAPVALAYLGYELALADNSPNVLVSQKATASSEEFVGRQHRAVLQVYQSALSESVAGSVRGPKNYHHELAVAASILSPLVQLATDIAFKSDIQILAVFAHGRLIDPAIYSRHTLH